MSGSERGLPLETLRIGKVGSRFIAHFHLQALLGVPNVRVAGVYSPTAASSAAPSTCRSMSSRKTYVPPTARRQSDA